VDALAEPRLRAAVVFRFAAFFFGVRRLLDRFVFAAARGAFRPRFAALAPPLALRLAIALILSEP
jgi:hypothetical protein